MATNLAGQLDDGLKAALKGKDTRTANLIRMIKTKIMERRTAAVGDGVAQPVVDDALVLDVISTYKKSMEKAKAEYAAAGDRGKEQLEELEFEIGWCKQWLPEALPEADLREAVAKAVAELPKKDPKMAGRVIGAIKKQFGDRADAQLVKKIAEELLSAP